MNLKDFHPYAQINLDNVKNEHTQNIEFVNLKIEEKYIKDNLKDSYLKFYKEPYQNLVFTSTSLDIYKYQYYKGYFYIRTNGPIKEDKILLIHFLDKKENLMTLDLLLWKDDELDTDKDIVVTTKKDENPNRKHYLGPDDNYYSKKKDKFYLAYQEQDLNGDIVGIRTKEDNENYPISSKFKKELGLQVKKDINGDWVKEDYKENIGEYIIYLPDKIRYLINMEIHAQYKYLDSSSQPKIHYLGIKDETLYESAFDGIEGDRDDTDRETLIELNSDFQDIIQSENSLLTEDQLIEKYNDNNLTNIAEKDENNSEFNYDDGIRGARHFHDRTQIISVKYHNDTIVIYDEAKTKGTDNPYTKVK